jgi:glycosyltransferase involved in cell wall biosynthesis
LCVVACAAEGPRAIVEAGKTGWLVPPDDEAALTEALIEAVANPADRGRRCVLLRRSPAAGGRTSAS